ncbi:NAD(P)-dependent oxidoreductase [Streptomyces sp. NBC_00726]|uniref:NAD-dependent epimerase/dehydratase family protein n=1 Tax=Streptomyces sp. NBC_00726 TaxID=2903674 RepID=UPI00386CE3CA
MRILVLGSTGYLGAHVAERLGALKDAWVLTGGRSPAAGVRVDLATDSADRLAKTLASAAPDAVVNCAGATGGDPVTLAEANARGPAVLCEAMALACPSARLVHFGSAAEYGPGTDRIPTAESAATRPLGAYGATKLAGTVTVSASALDALVLRVGNPVGPGAPPGGLPGRVVRLLREAGPDPAAVLRLGDLSAYRDFVDVRDVARAVERAVTAPGPLPRVLNIGGGGAVPVRELVHTLADIAGFAGRVEERGAGSARSGQVSWQCSDISAAGAALGWRPSYALRESLAALWSAPVRPPAPREEGDPSS